MSPRLPPSPTSNRVSVPWKETGIEIDVTGGLTIYAYHSLLDGRFVIEIETSTGGAIKHDELGVPQLKVMLNEAVVSDDGEALTGEGG